MTVAVLFYFVKHFIVVAFLMKFAFLKLLTILIVSHDLISVNNTYILNLAYQTVAIMSIFHNVLMFLLYIYRKWPSVDACKGY